MDSVGKTSDVTVAVENIGGIEEESFAFSPGVTVLTGKNATNRTSLLQSLMAALGSDDVSLKSDADHGEVTLTIQGESYTRTLERQDGQLQTRGDPYLDDSELADLFAFLLESNEARQAVRLGSALRELIMRPVDTAAIRDDIERLEAEKRRLDDELSELEALETELPELEERRTQLETAIAEQEAELEQKQAALDALDASLEDSKEEQERLDAKLSELETARADLERKQTQLSTEEASLDSLQEERAELEADRADLADDVDERLEQIEAELARVRKHKRSLDTTISQLGQVIQFNESVIDGESDAVLEALDTDESGPVTDQLLADEGDVVCWTCGSEVAESSISNTLDTLRTLRQEKVTERRECQDEIEDLQSDKRELESARSDRAQIRQRLDDIDDEIAQREETFERLQTEITSLEGEIAELEAAVQQRESTEYDEVLDRHREVNEAEFELDSLEADLDEVESEIDRIEAELDRRTELEAQRDSVAEELTEQRTKIDRLEAAVVDIFNEEMAAVLSLLDYDNIERIWIERREQETREGRRTVTEHVFDLHIVRGSTDGAAYEDRIENLSESEREVAGLVFALAGYLAHDVYESVPFMLLDSLEAIDAERIGDLIDYLRDYAPNLVVALLEEDAAAVDAEYERIEMGK